MTTAQVVEMSGPIQDYVHPDDQTQPTFSNENGPKGHKSVKKENKQ